MTDRVLLLATALLLGGCSEKKENPKADARKKTGKVHQASGDLPAKASQNHSRKDDLERREDRLWYKDGLLFDGVAVTRYDDGKIQWKETFKKGVRVGVNGWDEDGDQLELFSWDGTGQPLHQRP